MDATYLLNFVFMILAMQMTMATIEHWQNTIWRIFTILTVFQFQGLSFCSFTFIVYAFGLPAVMYKVDPAVHLLLNYILYYFIYCIFMIFSSTIYLWRISIESCLSTVTLTTTIIIKYFFDILKYLLWFRNEPIYWLIAPISMIDNSNKKDENLLVLELYILLNLIVLYNIWIFIVMCIYINNSKTEKIGFIFCFG